MADQENKPQDQIPAEPAGAEKEKGGGPVKTGSSPELEAEAQAAANKAPEGQKEAAAEEKVAEKIAEARAGVAEKGEAGSSGDKAKPAVSKSPEDAPASSAEEKPAAAKPPVEKPAVAAEKPAEEKPAVEKPAPAAKPAAAAKPPAAAGDKPAAAKPAAGAEGAPKKPAARAPATMPIVEIKDNPLIDAIKAKFGAAILEAVEISGQQVVRVSQERAHDLLSYLRNEASPEFNLLADLTAVHTPDKEKPFTIVYQTYSISATRRLRVKTEIADGDTIETATDIWSTANWLEREVYDLFGVRFANHPDLRRILLPQGWVGHPLRKEHPLEYQDNEWVSQNLKIRDLPEDWDYVGKFE
jgi:NADH-quinone oxidoreductase subunit C